MSSLQKSATMKCVLSATLLAAVQSTAHSEVVLSDNFDRGSFDPAIYEPLGGACLEVLGLCDDRTACTPGVSLCADGSTCSYRLVVHVFATPDDGVRINIPDTPGVGSPQCLELSQNIDPSRFAVSQAWRHTIEMENIMTGGITGFELTAVRPAWNRCEYKLTNKTTGESVTSAFFAATKEDNVKFQCPDPKCVRFDWLPPETPGGPERIQAEVTSKEAQAMIDKYKCRFIKESPITHDGGGTDTFRITTWEITSKTATDTGFN